ncbi:hypothetical protein [Pedobacter sp. GR22-10]|uniref:hypothetical protein n=1 Tax=Pedobacter sp. GR22-10 TaxID=2994472 RepID=UPI00224714E2|nr:hypothetical protein [Pedobacter sp. GR22-10]MCX2430267.1 hypothetical protein [Pedobacter sp. GR22-10]
MKRTNLEQQSNKAPFNRTMSDNSRQIPTGLVALKSDKYFCLSNKAKKMGTKKSGYF